MEQIIAFITPGSLKESVKFSHRVLSSWLSLGFAITFVRAVISWLYGNTLTLELFSLVLIQFLASIFSFGLLGLLVNKIRKEKNEYPGWYWYLFPLVSYFVIMLTITFAILNIFLVFIGISLSVPSWGGQRQHRSRFQSKQLQDDLENMKGKDVFKAFKNEIEEMKKLAKRGELSSEEIEVIFKLSSLDIEKYDSLLSEFLAEDELLIFIKLLFRLLGVEFK